MSGVRLDAECVSVSQEASFGRHFAGELLSGSQCWYILCDKGYSLAIAPVYRPLDWVSVMCYVYVVACEILVFAVHTLLRKHW
jgi:hypothetical protein